MLVSALVKIIRIQNALMTAVAVCLGYWLSRSPLPGFDLLMLIVAAVASVGFGNVTNDIVDVESDRISHPDRPLVRGDLSRRSAAIFAISLVIAAIATALSVSPVHAAATAVPLIALGIYALRLKATPVAGNVVVSLLVAFPIIYGGLMAPGLERLWIVAALAFLLNFAREIVKDVQDEAGDRSQRVHTTAALPYRLLRALLIAIAGMYVAIVFLPFALRHFGTVYLILVCAMVIPVHLAWIGILLRKGRERLSLVSLLIKLEMVGGLVALAADELAR